MSKDTETQAPTQDTAADDHAPALARDAVAPFESYMAAVPDAEGGGYESILAQIDQATDAHGLDAPWRTSGLSAYKDRQLRVTGLRKMPSEYEGGMPWFLVVDADELATGERVTFTTGAIGPVAQLVKAYALGLLPLVVVPKESERQTARGYTVWRLEVIG